MTLGLNEIKEAKKLNYKIPKLSLSGGEPTLHPRFLEVLAKINKKMPKTIISIMTNGGLFYEKAFTKKVLEVPNVEVVLSLHGFNQESFLNLTKTPYAYDSSFNAIKNIYENLPKNKTFETRFVINNYNYKNIPKMLNFINPFISKIKEVPLVFLLFSTNAIKNNLILKYSDVSSELKNLSHNFFIENKIKLYHFPFCVLDKKLWPYTINSIEKFRIKFLPKCTHCIKKNECTGIIKKYLDHYDDSEFLPITS
jgi:sulfatase maturation enzyme AslB (radical SAM superfamily)